jgi:23S rRNA G2445 N2-methylase RlmL
MRDPHKPGSIIVTCSRGATSVLEAELRELGFTARVLEETALAVTGTFADTLTMNLHLRSAQRVLLELWTGPATTADGLHAALVKLPWEDFIYPDGYLSITTSVDMPSINDPRFAALRVKDAIADRMNAVCGQRPNSGPDRTGVVLHLHWFDGKAEVYADTSGETLSRRGYRLHPGKAPMNEALAAACLLHSPWRGTGPLVNPMCGSGTLAIEGALIALRRAPGSLRKNFGFMHLKPYREEAWKELKRAAKTAELPRPPNRIIATDISPAMIEAAQKNAELAGVAEFIAFNVCDYTATEVPPEPGLIIVNPEYGERLGHTEHLEPVYRGLGDFFKQKCNGYWGYIFTGNLPLARLVGLRSNRRLTLYNANIECRLLEFELYTGTRDPGDGLPKKPRVEEAGEIPPAYQPKPAPPPSRADERRPPRRGPRPGFGPRRGPPGRRGPDDRRDAGDRPRFRPRGRN